MGGLYPIHPDVEGIPRDDDAVLHVHDPGDRLNGLRHRRAQAHELGLVIGIELDFYGLRSTGQVPDQVLHQLGKLYLQSGDRMLHPHSYVVHHLFDGRVGERASA